jgi:hypothetical protein
MSSPKLKPSSKEYQRDANGRMMQKWRWKHYTIASTSTEELEKYYTNPSYKRKKSVIKKELDRRHAGNR